MAFSTERLRQRHDGSFAAGLSVKVPCPTGTLPAVIVMGGGANALSLVRSFGRQRIPVYVLNQPREWVRYSRYARVIPLPADLLPEQAWARFLTSPESDGLRGAVLFSCSDAGIELLNQHREVLSRRFLLDDCNPSAQRCMLDKLRTYRAATAAGVPTPRFWAAPTRQEVLRLRDRLPYPLLVKPHFSHIYQGHFGRKFPLVGTFEELLAAYDQACAAGVEVMLVEFVPGPDSGTCSYYTYLDDEGRPLYEFTKSVVRRYPEATGIGCLEVSTWEPEVRDLALRLLRHVGLRGVANVEFKRDQRDGGYRLIECNARFSGATCLLVACGIDNALLVYYRLVGRPYQVPSSYRLGVKLWYPYEDYCAFRHMRRSGRIGAGQWLRSIVGRHVLPYFRWSDPLPSLIKEATRLKAGVRQRARMWAAAVCGHLADDNSRAVHASHK
jgi:D-aspartate ligase